MKSRNLAFRGRIDLEGNLVLANYTRQQMKIQFRERFKDTEVKIIVRKDHLPKTGDQLGYFFGVIIPWIMYGMILQGTEIQIDNDEDEKEVIKFLKEKFLDNGIEFILEGGLIEKGPPSIARADIDQKSNLIEKSIRFGNEFLGLIIPEPNRGKRKNVKKELIKRLEEKNNFK